jgi:hypothetical protein
MVYKFELLVDGRLERGKFPKSPLFPGFPPTAFSNLPQVSKEAGTARFTGTLHPENDA